MVLVNETAELAALVRSIAHRLIVVANNGLCNQSSEVVGVVPADTLNGNGDVGSGDGVVAYPDIGANEVGLLLGQEVGTGLGTLGGELLEVLVGKLNQLVMGNTTGTDQNHAVCSVVVLDVAGKLGPCDISDILAGAEDCAAQRLVLVCGGMKVVEDNLLKLLLNLLGLPENDVALALDGRLLELGVLENVLDDVDALGNILVECLGEVNSVLAL